jgi:hypothetical protein
MSKRELKKKKRDKERKCVKERQRDTVSAREERGKERNRGHKKEEDGV